jgi:hypothetical protein
MKPFWTTFYSYKGGVGRSLALANTAALLLKRGRRVVLIDFDLEAPGLDSFEEFKSIAGKPGVVEYVTEFEHTQKAPQITNFIHPCVLENKLRGKLWIMPAGKKDKHYNVCRSNLNWSRMYADGWGEPFVENWKAAIARHCNPDFVFVDSRTGLTEVGGICTLHLPDLVVMMFGLNEQNVNGIATVAKTIRESVVSKLPQIHYVASPIPNLPRDKKGTLDQRLVAASERLGIKIQSTIRYQQIASLNEKLFVLDKDLVTNPVGQDYQDTIEFEKTSRILSRSPLIQDYADLLESIITYNRIGLDFLWDQAQVAISTLDNSLMERLLPVFEEQFDKRPESLMAQAILNRALNKPEIAERLAHAALETDPTYDFPFRWLLDLYSRNKNSKAGLEICNLVLKHIEDLSVDRQYDLEIHRGQLAMAAGDYVAADGAYNRTIEYLNKKEKSGEFDPETLMIQMFNDLESSRRSKQISTSDMWPRVLELFKMTGDASTAPLIFQANRWQAMHVAFAMTGNILKAREALAKARQAAERLGPTENIFTVMNYTDVPVGDFLKINEEMLTALDRGELWDGMKLPNSHDFP